MFHSILSIHDDVTWHDSSWIMDDYLRIIELTTDAIDAVISPGWALHLLAVALENILLSWTHVAQEHGSITIGTFCVVMAFGGVWS